MVASAVRRGGVTVSPAVAGATATLATWIISALVIWPWEPALGPIWADVLMIVAGALGVIVYAPVKSHFEKKRARR